MKRLLALALLIFSSPTWAAIAYVGKGAADDEGTGGTSITPGLPAASTGDVEFMVTGHATGQQGTVSGWTAEAWFDGRRNVRFYHRTRPGAPTAPTVTADAAQAFLGIIYAFSGVDTTSPIDATQSCQDSADRLTATMTAPAITTNTANTMVLRIYMSENADGTTHNTHSEGTLAGVESTTLGQDVQISMTYVAKATAGSTGTATAVTTAPSGSRGWTACTIALKEAGSGTPTVVFDATTYDLGDTLTASASGFSSTLTTLTEQAGGDVINAQAGASSTVAVYRLPTLDDLAPAGVANNTQVGVSLTYQITDGTDTATDTLTLACPTDAFCGNVACASGSCPGDSLVPSGVVVNDDYICRVLAGNASFNDYLVPAVAYSAVIGAVTVGCRIFDESAGVWLAEVETQYDLPTTAFLTPDSETITVQLCSDGEYREVCE